jgi:hypothetical protein
MNKKKSSCGTWTFLNHRKCSSVQVPKSTLIELNLDPQASAAQQRLLRDAMLWSAAAAVADDMATRVEHCNSHHG